MVKKTQHGLALVIIVWCLKEASLVDKGQLDLFRFWTRENIQSCLASPYWRFGIWRRQSHWSWMCTANYFSRCMQGGWGAPHIPVCIAYVPRYPFLDGLRALPCLYLCFPCWRTAYVDIQTFSPSHSPCKVGTAWGAAQSCDSTLWQVAAFVLLSWHHALTSHSQPSELYRQNFNQWLLNFTVAFGLDLPQIKSALGGSLQCHLPAGIRGARSSTLADLGIGQLSLSSLWLKLIRSSLSSHSDRYFSASINNILIKVAKWSKSNRYL